jgi:hypothetical protein
LSTCAPHRLPIWNPKCFQGFPLSGQIKNYQIFVWIPSQSSENFFIRALRVGIRCGALYSIHSLVLEPRIGTQDSNHVFDDWYTAMRGMRVCALCMHRAPLRIPNWNPVRSTSSQTKNRVNGAKMKLLKITRMKRPIRKI